MRQRGKAKSIPQSQDSVLVSRTAIAGSIWRSRSKQIVTYLTSGVINLKKVDFSGTGAGTHTGTKS